MLGQDYIVVGIYYNDIVNDTIPIEVPSNYTIGELKAYINDTLLTEFTPFNFKIMDYIFRSDTDLKTKSLRQLNIESGTIFEILPPLISASESSSETPEPEYKRIPLREDNSLHLTINYMIGTESEKKKDVSFSVDVPSSYTLNDLKTHLKKNKRIPENYRDFSFFIDDNIERSIDTELKTLKTLNIINNTTLELMPQLVESDQESDQESKQESYPIHQQVPGQELHQYAVISLVVLGLTEFVIISSTFIISLIKFKHKNAYIFEIILILVMISLLIIRILFRKYTNFMIIHITIVLIFSVAILFVNKAIIYQIRFAYYIMSFFIMPIKNFIVGLQVGYIREYRIALNS